MMMISHLIAVFVLSAVALGQDCGGNPALACMDSKECGFGPCIKDLAADFLGCCYGDLPRATTRKISTTVRPATNCVDLSNPQTGVPDCPSRLPQCRDPVYYNVMRQQCPRTCGFCTGAPNPAPNPPSAACVDLIGPTGVYDCPSKRAYCTNPVYVPLMRQQCRRTCGFC